MLALPYLPVLPWNKLRVGDRIRLSGGHSMDPPWLAGRSSVSGRVETFIPGQNDQAAVVAQLDEPLEFDGVRGSVVVLELRFVGAGMLSLTLSCATLIPSLDVGKNVARENGSNRTRRTR